MSSDDVPAEPVAMEATPDLRARYAEAAARWALMYPISSWSLADGEKAVRLAKVWGEQIARFLDESVRDEHLAHMTARAVYAEGQVLALRDHRARWGLEKACADEAEAEVERLRTDLTTARGQVADYRATLKSSAEEHFAEVERLQAELAETREKLAELRDLQVGIKSLTTDDGGIDMSLHMAHDMMRAVVAGFVKILDSVDAPNYVELSYSLRDDPERYTVVIQRPCGATPAEVAGEAKRQAREAEAERDRLRARLTGVAIHARRLKTRIAPGTDAWSVLGELFAALETPAQATTEEKTDEH